MADFSFLVGKAAQIVADHYAGAQLGEITFRPTGATASQVSDLVVWNFVFSIDDGRALISFENGRFSEPTRLDGMLVGDRLISPPINKSLADAFEILRAAKYADPIEFVRLRQALNFGPSGPKEPSYEFHFPKADFEIHVGSNTGTLSKLAVPAA